MADDENDVDDVEDGGNDGGFVERTVGDWTAYQDDEGRVYYHNDRTEESSWDPPPGFEDDADADAGAGDDGAAGDAVDGPADGDAGEEGPETPPPDGDAGAEDDGFARSPAAEDDGFARSPAATAGDDGFAPSPTAEDDGFTRSPTAGDDGFTRSPADDDGFTRSPTAGDDGITSSPPPSSPVAEAEAEAEETGGDAGGAGDDDVADGTELGGGWVAYRDAENEGQVYYYHAETGETQWDRPDVGDGSGSPAPAPPRSPSEAPPDADADERGGDEERAPLSPPPEGAAAPAEAPADDRRRAASASPSAAEEEVEETAEEEPADPAALAEEFLSKPDAVMEPGVLDHIGALVKELGAQVAGPKAMQSLMNGYVGGATACGLMGLWLAELKSAGKGRGGGGGDASEGGSGAAARSAAGSDAGGGGGGVGAEAFRRGADAARDVAGSVLGRLARERFTTDLGDAIVKLSKREAAFVDGMIKSDRWRALLIDLAGANRDSRLFMYCLQSIADQGHHRAIAGRVGQSDYFGVFNSVLSSELTALAKIAVDGHAQEVLQMAEDDGGDAMGSVVADLRTTCSSTSYTYLYAMRVLGELISKAEKTITEGNGGQKEGLRRAVRKWERLREELEDEMLQPLKTGTTFQRKRRIDAALTMSDLFQRKRRRGEGPGGMPNEGSGNGIASSNGNLADALDAALLQMLTKNSLGVPMDKEAADNVLKYAYGGSTDRIGDLLVQHPSGVTALLRSLFGSKRVRQLETRLKCARLVALAVTAAERRAVAEGGNVEEGSDEDALAQIILKASQLCEQLENMVSFVVVEDAGNDDVAAGGGSVGAQVSVMCLRHAVVSQGVLIWAREFASGPDFVSAASYPTISPCILSLARLIGVRHPLARPAVLDLALVFMGHSDREVSHRKMEMIKEQCLRLILWMSTRGMALAAIAAVRGMLEGGGTSEMDSALVRYFFAGMLEIVQPPLSLAFARALGGLMAKRPCVDALLSKHFEASKRKDILRLINLFEATASAQKKAVLEEDRSLLTTLQNTYCKSSLQ
ncbi:hypothetical protein ACHAWF_007946 [Thalassiosira exigua]